MLFVYITLILFINLVLARDNSQEDKISPYRFSYEINDADHQQFRREQSDHQKIKGSYGYRKPSGEFSAVDFFMNKNQGISDEESNPFNMHYVASEMPRKMGNENKNDLKLDEIEEMRNEEMQYPEELKSDQEDMREEIEEEKEGKDVREEVTTPATVSSTSKSSILMKLTQLISQHEKEEPSHNLIKQSLDEERMKNDQISIHQLIREAMPNLQMSISFVHFLNKVTHSLVSIPYLVMKSTSKFPLLPGSFNSLDNEHNLFNIVNFRMFKPISSKPFEYNEPLSYKRGKSERYFRPESSYHKWLTLSAK